MKMSSLEQYRSLLWLKRKNNHKICASHQMTIMIDHHYRYSFNSLLLLILLTSTNYSNIPGALCSKLSKYHQETLSIESTINHQVSHSIHKREWKSPLPVPLPGIGEPIGNDYDDDLNPIDSSQDSNEDVYNNETRKLGLGHRCHIINITKHSQDDHYKYQLCQDDLQCRRIPVNNKHIVPDFGFCTKVDCRKDCHQKSNSAQIQCPNDSLVMTKIIENNGQRCCFHFCVCNETKCTEMKDSCTRGHDKIEKGTSMPGKCCDRIKCIQTKPKDCVDINDRTYESGKSWQRLEDCHDCKCIDGVKTCGVINNCPIECLPANQSIIQLRPDQCCLPCKGCIHEGKRYEHLQTWLDNDCRRCECKNDKFVCDYEFGGPKFCDRPCTSNERREWQKDKCCDKCECTLHCPYGFKINQTAISVNSNRTMMTNSSQFLCECRDDPFDSIKQQHMPPLPPNEHTMSGWDKSSQIDHTNSNNQNSFTSIHHIGDPQKQDNRNHHSLTLPLVIAGIVVIALIVFAYCYFIYKQKRSRTRTRTNTNANSASSTTKYDPVNNHFKKSSQNDEDEEEMDNMDNNNVQNGTV